MQMYKCKLAEYKWRHNSWDHFMKGNHFIELFRIWKCNSIGILFFFSEKRLIISNRNLNQWLLYFGKEKTWKWYNESVKLAIEIQTGPWTPAAKGKENDKVNVKEPKQVERNRMFLLFRLTLINSRQDPSPLLRFCRLRISKISN